LQRWSATAKYEVCETYVVYAKRTDCLDILTACDWDLPSAMAMLMEQRPKAAEIFNVTEQASRVLKIRTLMKEAENATHEG
jgi:hypothetical protein